LHFPFGFATYLPRTETGMPGLVIRLSTLRRHCLAIQKTHHPRNVDAAAAGVELLSKRPDLVCEHHGSGHPGLIDGRIERQRDDWWGRVSMVRIYSRASTS
jgi:hypothetical protein